MKIGQRKWMGMYAVTSASAVYLDVEKEGGSSKTLQDAIDGGEFLTPENLKDAIKLVLGATAKELVTYKGLFSFETYSTKDFRATCTKGDYWIYMGDGMLNIDTAVLYPNGIVYFDGTYFRTIYMPYQNDVKPKTNYDVVILGAGAGGIGAAYALRNSGWRVALVERLDTLGGTHCNGVGLYLPSPSLPWFKDLFMECYDLGLLGFKVRQTTFLKGVGEGTDVEKAYRGTQFCDDHGKKINGFSGNYIINNDYKLSQKYYNDLKDDLDIFINTELIKTNSADGKVHSIQVRNAITGKEFEISGDYFIDCSGDGALYASDPNLTLDTDFYIGTDPAVRFGEVGTGMYSANYPGDHNGINTMEPIRFQCRRKYHTGFAFPPLPEKYKRFDNLSQRANFVYSALGDDAVQIVSVSNSRGNGMSAHDFIEKSYVWNYGNAYDRAEAYFMTKSSQTAAHRYGGIRPLLAIREKYRVNADNTLDASWLLKQLTSANYADDRIIAISSWYPDIHTGNQSYSPPYTVANGVPYDTMIPVAYGNVWVACRGAGFSHLAASSIRLVKTMHDMGYAAGTAAAQLLDSGVRGDVRTVDVPALQQKIRIVETIQEMEEHYYSPTVQYEELPETL